MWLSQDNFWYKNILSMILIKIILQFYWNFCTKKYKVNLILSDWSYKTLMWLSAIKQADLVK